MPLQGVGLCLLTHPMGHEGEGSFLLGAIPRVCRY